jgi:DNA-binding transcriptional MerR regulator
MNHVGRVENTGRRCLVVFREVYDERGNVIEPDKCLVVETDTLPDFAHQDLMSIVESEPAQREGEFFNVLARTRLSNGDIALQWLHSQGRLRKYDTSNITLLPNSNSKISLNTLNRILELQKAGYSDNDIERILKDNNTDVKPVAKPSTTKPVNEPLTDEKLAESFLSQAKTLLEQAQKLQDDAYELAPHLKPTKRKSVSSKSKDAVKDVSVENT